MQKQNTSNKIWNNLQLRCQIPKGIWIESLNCERLANWEPDYVTGEWWHDETEQHAGIHARHGLSQSSRTCSSSTNSSSELTHMLNLNSSKKRKRDLPWEAKGVMMLASIGAVSWRSERSLNLRLSVWFKWLSKIWRGHWYLLCAIFGSCVCSCYLEAGNST